MSPGSQKPARWPEKDANGKPYGRPEGWPEKDANGEPYGHRDTNKETG